MSIMTLNPAHFKACAYSVKLLIKGRDFHSYPLQPFGLCTYDNTAEDLESRIDKLFKNLYKYNYLAFYAKYESAKSWTADAIDIEKDYTKETFKTALELPALHKALSSINYQIEPETVDHSNCSAFHSDHLKESLQFLKALLNCVAYEYIKNKCNEETSKNVWNIEADKVQKVVSIFDL